MCFRAKVKSGSLELAMLNVGVDYLLIAKSVAFNQLKIRRDCVQSLVDSTDYW